eukprot:PLAT7078.4.p1 GENE.PLAT7078.4~~PLAT7078.4.p1  ORF type:complete len:1195 (-),score=572.55 PLAT7078.4:48-3632(-)
MVDVRLSCPVHVILGETIPVRYEYSHRRFPGKLHTPFDWLGMFRLSDDGDGDEASDGDGEGTEGGGDGGKADDSAASVAVGDSHASLSAAMTASQAKAAAKAAAADLSAPIGADLTPGGGEGQLVGWVMLPKENKGTVRFRGVPQKPGRYAVRYFVHGSECRVGPEQLFEAQLVKVNLTVPPTVECGRSLVVDYRMDYSSGDFHDDRDWLGLFSSTEDRCIARKLLPRENAGHVTFKNTPAFPGTYDLRLFLGSFGNSEVARSSPVEVTVRIDRAEADLLHRRVRIFVASALGDMVHEREHFRCHVAPKLAQLCGERQVYLSFTDLEPTPSASRFSWELYIHTMLREIDECSPFFVGVLGERLGMVPPYPSAALMARYPWLRTQVRRGVSLLELALLAGQFFPAATAELHHTFFYIRHQSFTPAAEAQENSAVFDAVMTLKARIKASTDRVYSNFTSKVEAGDLMLHDLQQSINTLFPASSVPSPLVQSLMRSECVVRRLKRDYLSADARLLERLGRHVMKSMKDEHTRGFVLGGGSGQGKSSAFYAYVQRVIGLSVFGERVMEALPDGTVDVVDDGGGSKGDGAAAGSGILGMVEPRDAVVDGIRLRNRAQSRIVFRDDRGRVTLLLCLFLGLVERSVDEMRLRILQEVASVFEVGEDVPSHVDAQRDALPRFLAAAGRQGQVVLLLDGLDSLMLGAGAEAELAVERIISHAYEGRVAVIITVTNKRVLKWCQAQSLDVATLTGLPMKHFQDVVDARFDSAPHSVPQLRNALIRSGASHINPLFLQFFLDYNTPAGLSPLPPAWERALAQTVLAQSFNRSHAPLLRWFCHTHAYARQVLCLIRASRRGLTEMEVLQLLGATGSRWPWMRKLEFNSFLWSLTRLKLLQRHVIDLSGMWLLAHSTTRRDLESCFIRKEEPHRWQDALITFFKRQPMSSRKVQELPWQLYQAARAGRADMTEQLWFQITDLPMFSQLMTAEHEQDFWMYVHSVHQTSEALVYALRSNFEAKYSLQPFAKRGYEHAKDSKHPGISYEHLRDSGPPLLLKMSACFLRVRREEHAQWALERAVLLLARVTSFFRMRRMKSMPMQLRIDVAGNVLSALMQLYHGKVLAMKASGTLSASRLTKEDSDELDASELVERSESVRRFISILLSAGVEHGALSDAAHLAGNIRDLWRTERAGKAAMGAHAVALSG